MHRAADGTFLSFWEPVRRLGYEYLEIQDLGYRISEYATPHSYAQRTSIERRVE